MARILILWNQLEDDVYTHFRREDRRGVDWDPSITVEPWDTVDEEMQLLRRAIESGGHETQMVNIRDSFDTMLGALRSYNPDAIVNLVEFFRDDAEFEHDVPALFELLGFEYTGNRPLPLSLCQKKPVAKALLLGSGVSVPRGLLVSTLEELDGHDLTYPLMVKPAYDDASGGIDAGSVVSDAAALRARVQKVFDEQKQSALVEEYIAGREIHCAILGGRPLPLFEMQFKDTTDENGAPLPKIITYRAKWDPYSRDHHAVQGVCPAPDLDAATVERIEATAVAAYQALGCRDYARVDMRLDANNTPYVLEVNPNPDLAESCAFHMSAAAAGRTYEQMILEIIELPLSRKRGPRKAIQSVDALLNEYLAQKKQQ